MATTTTTYTEHLEARAAWYAAHIVDLVERVDDYVAFGERARAMRAADRIARLRYQAENEGLAHLVATATTDLLCDAERVQDLIAGPKPRLPR